MNTLYRVQCTFGGPQDAKRLHHIISQGSAPVALLSTSSRHSTPRYYKRTRENGVPFGHRRRKRRLKDATQGAQLSGTTARAVSVLATFRYLSHDSLLPLIASTSFSRIARGSCFEPHTPKIIPIKASHTAWQVVCCSSWRHMAAKPPIFSNARNACGSGSVGDPAPFVCTSEEKNVALEVRRLLSPFRTWVTSHQSATASNPHPVRHESCANTRCPPRARGLTDQTHTRRDRSTTLFRIQRLYALRLHIGEESRPMLLSVGVTRGKLLRCGSSA